MPAKNSAVRLIVVLAVIAVTVFAAATQANAQVENLLFSFDNNGATGNFPAGGLILDASGNLYGTTSQGGNPCEGDGCGTIFELTPKSRGVWSHKVLYYFSGPDGGHPVASLIFDKSGNLYGTTYAGGTSGCGVVFELSPKAGSWTQKVLYSFANTTTDGCGPQASVTFDAAGNLYGTTAHGGTGTCDVFPYTCGTVFELMPQPGGVWTEKLLHSFSGVKKDGYDPTNVTLVIDGGGNLYGTTLEGGGHNFGTVFELTPKANGHWTEKVLHSFHLGKDGAYPEQGLTIDAAGNLYGTTYAGGKYGYGIVFEMSSKAGKDWTEKIIHAFNPDGTDGYQPQACNLILDSAGNLYGATTWGGPGYRNRVRINAPIERHDLD